MTEINPPAQLLDFFKALADETRLKIVGLLANEPRSVEEIAALLRLAPSTISHHLSKLQKVGLVKAESQQYYNIYALNTAHLQTLAQTLLKPSAILEAAGKNLETDPDDAVRKLMVEPGRIAFKSKGHPLKLILAWLHQKFEPNVRYTELQIDDILETHCAHESNTVRRYMIDYKYLARKRDGSLYWRADSPLAQTPDFDPYTLRPSDHQPSNGHDLILAQVQILKSNINNRRVSLPDNAEQVTSVLQLMWKIIGRRFSKGIDYSAGQLDAVIQRFFNDDPARVREVFVINGFMAHDTRRDVYKLVDDTPEYDQRVLAGFLVDGRLKEIPAQLKKRQAVLRFLADKFEPRKRYTEKQVNEIIKQYHDDFAALRRYLIGERFLDRKDGMYWLR